MSPRKYYYTTDDRTKPVGPVSLEDLRALAMRREINLNTPVIVEGAEEWGRYGDFYSGERTKEVAEAMIDRASRVAAAFRTDESKSFTLGFMIGLVRVITLPWELIRAAVRIVAGWGADRFISIPQDRMASATLGRIFAPVFILLWTFFWAGDCVTMLIFGRPSFSITVLSIVGSSIIAGIPSMDLSYSQSIMSAAARAGIAEALTVHDFGNRLIWAIKIALFGYSLTVAWALVGEFFSGLAALIGLRRRSGPDRGMS